MFKDILNKKLEANDLSVYQVAKETNIPKSTLYEWSSGEREPFSGYLVPLADYLGCSVDYLLGTTDNPNINK